MSSADLCIRLLTKLSCHASKLEKRANAERFPISQLKCSACHHPILFHEKTLHWVCLLYCLFKRSEILKQFNSFLSEFMLAKHLNMLCATDVHVLVLIICERHLFVCHLPPNRHKKTIVWWSCLFLFWSACTYLHNTLLKISFARS